MEPMNNQTVNSIATDVAEKLSKLPEVQLALIYGVICALGATNPTPGT